MLDNGEIKLVGVQYETPEQLHELLEAGRMPDGRPIVEVVEPVVARKTMTLQDLVAVLRLALPTYYVDSLAARQPRLRIEELCAQIGSDWDRMAHASASIPEYKFGKTPRLRRSSMPDIGHWRRIAQPECYECGATRTTIG